MERASQRDTERLHGKEFIFILQGIGWWDERVDGHLHTAETVLDFGMGMIPLLSLQHGKGLFRRKHGPEERVHTHSRSNEQMKIA
jgi:hypothetical protein